MRETPRTEACSARPTDATTITTGKNSVNAPGYQLTIHSRLREYVVGAISYLVVGAWQNKQMRSTEICPVTYD